ncbi:MAG: hypothetical protein ACR2JG_14190 [Geodermatophilaceae bacterium]
MSLTDLPDRYDVFAFFSGRNIEPTFVEHHRELTSVAALNVDESLVQRGAAPSDGSAAPSDEIQRGRTYTPFATSTIELVQFGSVAQAPSRAVT